MDWSEHNRRSERIWRAYNEGNPIRVPVTIYADVRNWLAEPGQNTRGVRLADYLRDPDLMFDCQVRAEEWIRDTIVSDGGMGPPGGWSVRVDFQNFLEAAWLGAEVVWAEEPHTRPYLRDDDKHSILDRDLPDPAGGICAQVLRYYERQQVLARERTWKGIPVAHVSLPFNMLGSDGPFTIACAIRGAEAFVTDMVEDPDYADALLDWITDAIILRVKATRRYLGEPEVSDGYGFADDAIVLLSPDLYRRHVLSRHRRVYEALSLPGSFRSMHLCGDHQRFFPILAETLNVKSFDTGFPIDFGRLYRELGPDVQILGGPAAALLRNGKPAEVREEVRRILTSGVMRSSRRFVLREANALSPGTPAANVRALYDACEEFGYY